MILFYSGTGNSEYIAKKLAETTHEPIINLFDKIRNNDYSSLTSMTPWIIVTPTYTWRIPKILHNWLKHTNLKGSKKIYFIMTCGGSIGNANKYLSKLCHTKNMDYMGCYPIVMPDNYIVLSSAPTKKECLQIFEKAETAFKHMTYYLDAGQPFPQATITIKDKLRSGITNDLFYPLFIQPKKFYVTNACISCGQCVAVCPLRNIHLENQKPVWGKNCTHCMACICKCPKTAIEYGKQTKERIRYICPK